MRKQTVFAALFALLGVVSCSDSGMPGQGGAPSSSGGSSGGVGSSSSSSGSGGSGTVSAADLPRDCFWAACSDPNAANTLYPDSYATYWVASINIPAGGQVILKGRYPHARYLSFNLYNPRLEPLDALADVEIAPNASSAQPYAVNARRDATPRDYTVSIVAGVRPDDAALRAPNTLYSFQAVGAQRQPSNQAVILYRIYVEDQGRGGPGFYSSLVEIMTP